MMDEWIEKYKKVLNRQELAESTIKTYVAAAVKFCQYAADQLITKELVMEYKVILQKKYAVATVNLYLIAINRFLCVIGYENCRVKTLKYQTRGSLENVINNVEYQKMLTYAIQKKNRKYYMMIRTLGMTGIRISELRYITVEAVKRGYTVINNKGKYREIYIPDELQELLLDYCESQNIETGAVFLGNTGQPISREAVWRGLKRYAENAGVEKEKVYPHSFRHHFALSYMEANSNIFELADILGHRDLSTTRIYMASSIEDKRRHMSNMGL